MRNPDNEDWLWRAHYTDGTVLEETPDDGEDHAFRHIDLARCYAIELAPQRPHLGTHIVKVDPAKGERPIFYRRRYAGASVGDIFDGEGNIILVPTRTIHVLGWQTTVNGTNVATYSYYCNDGSTLISSDPNAI